MSQLRKKGGFAIARRHSRLKGRRLTLSINGRQVETDPTFIALFECLQKERGRVVPYKRLCLILGYESPQAPELHTLRQYIWRIREALAAHQTPFVVAVAHNIGYALCTVTRSD